ncbi:MAG: hypothetical protein A4E62_02191 [Syntrophorhabdus sp. PtaU1.Bin002]|nr:MAG: hypothetical protein A4E58_01258 [Syntrophorhabdus sp. PtaB.Bin006]OPY67767.1 MAG: hypothetical protein A4E62_02191 [Syntrophorhabdus sp. PtaU1.Bin002]
MATVLLITSLDTRRKETLLLKEYIEKEGCSVLLMDISMGALVEGLADYGCVEVAKAGGSSFDVISKSSDTNKNMGCMVKGSGRIVGDLWTKAKIQGIAGFGGTSNVTVISLVMKELPFGFPKLILSSSAAIPALAARFFANTDIVMFHSCVELNGLNYFVKDALSRFAALIGGVLHRRTGTERHGGEAIALTEFKFAEGCAERVRKLLEQRGLEVVPFSATGASDCIMEEMVSKGLFKGVVDLVPSGLSEALLGGNRSAGLDRLDRELEGSVPVILTPCGFDMISCGPYERKDTDPYWKRKRIGERKLFIPDKYRVQARTTRREMEMIGRVFAEKLNKAGTKVAVFIPLRGFSSLSCEGGPLHDPQADSGFLKVLRAKADRQKVEIHEMDCAIDDQEFAEVIIDRFVRMVADNDRCGLSRVDG